MLIVRIIQNEDGFDGSQIIHVGSAKVFQRGADTDMSTQHLRTVSSFHFGLVVIRNHTTLNKGFFTGHRRKMAKAYDLVDSHKAQHTTILLDSSYDSHHACRLFPLLFTDAGGMFTLICFEHQG